ncbi:PrgI family protein [Enterococcus cecorum]
MHSQFYLDFSKVDKKYRGFSKTQYKGLFFMAIAFVIIVLMVLFLPNSILYTIGMPIALLIATVPILIFMGTWRKVKRKIAIQFLYDKAEYYTGQIRRYEANEFIQAKNVKETDKIT